MRRPWSEHGDEATQRTPEGEARARRLAEVAYEALASGHDTSRGQPGIDGRCRKHKIRDCRCEETTRWNP
jgi:hypothetical protein